MVSCLDHAAEYPSVLIAHTFRTAASYVEAANLARVTAGLPPQVTNRGYEAHPEAHQPWLLGPDGQRCQSPQRVLVVWKGLLRQILARGVADWVCDLGDCRFSACDWSCNH
jgi:hypothetical protein